MIIKSCVSANNDSVMFSVTEILNQYAPELIISEIAKAVAQRFVAGHYQEIIIRRSLSVAEAAAKIRETLEKKIPDKILEVHTQGKNEAWQRGIFGGMRKL